MYYKEQGGTLYLISAYGIVLYHGVMYDGIHVIHVHAYTCIYIPIHIHISHGPCVRCWLLLSASPLRWHLTQICQHITIGNMRHCQCMCIMHETRISTSCIPCIPVLVTYRPDMLMVVVIIAACFPAKASQQMHSAILIAATSEIDPSYLGHLYTFHARCALASCSTSPAFLLPHHIKCNMRF